MRSYGSLWKTFNTGAFIHCGCFDVEHRGRKVLENRNINDEERISQLEKELEETILLGEESDRKFEEVSLRPNLRL